jgi:hypothetical protein
LLGAYKEELERKGRGRTTDRRGEQFGAVGKDQAKTSLVADKVTGMEPGKEPKGSELEPSAGDTDSLR